MAWLGSTIKSLDTRKELVNYIGGNTQPSRVVVTNSGGEIDSSVVTVAELALHSGVSSNVQMQLTALGNDKEDAITAHFESFRVYRVPSFCPHGLKTRERALVARA